MATFKGFNTQGQVKKFGLTDFDLIKRDILNAFLIREGQLPGRPDLGTTIWTYVFEPLVAEVRDQIENEVRRVIAQDSRVVVDQLDITDNHNTVIVELRVSVRPNMSPETLFLIFDQAAESLNVVS